MTRKNIILLALLAIILIAIPITVFLQQQQQDIRQQAAGTTTLSFSPASNLTSPITKNLNDSFSLDMVVNPGDNAVSVVRFEISYDPTKIILDTNPFTANTEVFPAILEGPIYTTGKISGTVSIGSDYSKAVRSTANVGTFRFKAKGGTGSSSTIVKYTTNTQVLSTGSNDEAAENVLSSTFTAYLRVIEAVPTPTTQPSPTSCTAPGSTGLGKITGNTSDKCEKITWTWAPVPGATEYIITLDGVEKYRGLGIPCTFDTTKRCHTISNLTPKKYSDCLVVKNACGTSSPSCGLSNVGACPVVTATPTPTSIPTPTRTPTLTSTPVPTNTPIPTATIAPQASKFSITAFMHGIGNSGDNSNPNSFTLSNKNPIRQQRTIVVEVFNASNNLVLTKSGTVMFNSSTGNFTGIIDMGTTLTQGSYIVKIKSPQYLRRSVPGIHTVNLNQTTTLPAITFVTGDVVSDNKLNILDYNVIVGCYSDFAPATSCTSQQKLDADLTDDGKVNQFDYNLFLRDLSVQNGE